MRSTRWANGVRADPATSWRARTVAGVLGDCCTGGDQPRSVMSVARLAEMSGLSAASVKRGLRELVGLQWVVPLHRHRKACQSADCHGCVASQWLLIPRPQAVDDDPQIPDPRSDRPTPSVSQTHHGWVSQTHRKDKSEVKGNVVAFVDRFGRLP